MKKKAEVTLKLEELRLNGMKFSLGDKEMSTGITISNIKFLKEINMMIKCHINFIEEYQPFVDYYKDFENKIDVLLDDQAVFFEENGHYEVGADFGLFLGNRNNHNSSKYIKELIKDKFGKNNLEVEAEYSYCYVYSKDRKEAARFLLFTYRNIIKPYLENL